MDSLVISIISKYLKDFVNNFRPEQITLNFLGGQGVMRNLDINVQHINEAFLQGSQPALKFTRILINKLSIEAPSILNIKSKPIIFFIDEMFVELSESEDVQHKAKSPNDYTPKKTPLKYGFLDRVVDSISFEINKIHFAFRTLGKAKTLKVGEWTPPVLLIEMSGSRIVCTNHNNVECDLEECFRVRPTKRQMLFLYKKFEIKNLSIYLVNPDLWFSVADELIANTSKNIMQTLNSKLKPGIRGYVYHTLVKEIPFEIIISMRKRLDNHRLLGLEINFSVDKLYFNLRQPVFIEFLHWVMGVSYSLWRVEAVKEVYGPDPHGEKDKDLIYNLNPAGGGGVGGGESLDGGKEGNKNKPLSSQDSSSILSQSIARSANAPPFNANTKIAAHLALNKGRLTRDFFGEAEREQINALEAEFDALTPQVLDSDWQRSSLNSDDDPPHLRLAIVFQANEIRFEFPLDGIKRPPFPSTFNPNSESEEAHKGRISQGIVLSMKTIVFSSIWPEHAGLTESVLQLVMHNLSLSEYKGLSTSYLLRICKPLDVNGKQIDVALIPRGVKEINYFDPEVLPGASFVYKKESSWPPPPFNGRVGATSEYLISEVELTVDIDAWSQFVSYCIGAWEPRWITGLNYPNMPSETLTEKIVGSGTFETTLNCRGIKAVLFPNTSSLEQFSNGPILPSEIIFSCDEFQLINRAHLKMRFLDTLFEGLDGGGMDTFPSCSTDILSMIRTDIGGDNPLHTKKRGKNKLISIRMQITFSNVSLEVSTDYFSSKKFNHLNQDTDYGQFNPPTKPLVRPFAITYYNSIDPNPSVAQVIPGKEIMLDPYSRPYYCSVDNTAINTSFVGVKDLVIECSMLDIIRFIHTYDVISAKVLQSDAVAWLYPRKQNQDGTITSVILNQPAKIFIAKVINFEVKVVASAKSIEVVKQISELPPLIALHTRNLQVSFEQPATNDESEYLPMDTRPDPVVVVKALICGIAATVCGVPVLLLTSSGGNSGTNNPTQLAAQLTLSGDALLKFLDGPTAAVRYEFRPGQTHSVFKQTSTLDAQQISKMSGTYISKENKQILVTVKNAPDIGVLKVELTRGSRMLTVPKLMEIAAQQIAMEMLRGFGSVRSQPITWWEDSVYGYVVKRFGLERSSVFSVFVQDSVSLKESSLSEQDKARISTLAFRITAKYAFDIVILETENYEALKSNETKLKGSSLDSQSVAASKKTPPPTPTSNQPKFLVVSLMALDINGKSLPGPPRTSNIKLSGTMQLVLLKEELGKIGQSTISRDICNPFTIVTEIRKTGDEAFHVKTNISLTEIALDLPRQMASDALAILDDAFTAFQGVSRVMVKFRSIVVDCCPSLNVTEDEYNKDESSIVTATRGGKAITTTSSSSSTLEERKMALAVALDISQMMSSSNQFTESTWFKKSESNYVNEFESEGRKSKEDHQLRSQKVLIEKLQDHLANGYRQLKSAMTSVNDYSIELDENLNSIREISSELNNLLDKVKSATVITAGQIPTYCGWIRRSVDFSKVEIGKGVRKFNKTAGNLKWWASLINDRLFFMLQPYGCKADVEIKLDSVSIVDPDDEKIAGKVILSTCIWICDEEGAMVFNASSLDEKQMWLKAFSPWLSHHPSITKEGKPTKRVSLKSTTSSSVPAIDLMSKGLASIGLSSNLSQQSLSHSSNPSPSADVTGLRESPTNFDVNDGLNMKKGASKLFRSATKGMLKAFGVKNSYGNTSSENIPVASNKMENRPSITPQETPVNNNNHNNKRENMTEEIIVKTPILDEAVIQHSKSVELNGDSNGGIQSYYPKSLQDLIVELDNLRTPLQKTHQKVIGIKQESQRAILSSSNLLTTAQELIGKAAIGLAAVKVLHEEVHDEKETIEVRCEAAVNSARSELWAEKQNAVSLREKWSRAKQLQEQLESVLEFSADQNNAQVKILNKKYTDISSQYDKLRSVNPTYVPSGNPNDFKELVKQLTINIGDTERMLKESEERGCMSLEENLSILLNLNIAREEVKQMKNKFTMKEKEYNVKTEKLASELYKEKKEHEISKKTSNVYKERVISLFSAVTSLGLDVGKSSQFTNLQPQNEILSKEVEKTLICLEISPADENVDLQMLWSQIIENFHMEGLTWGENYKLEPIGYGLNKLLMSCTIVDSLVNLDDITESIESLDDWVQSVTVLSMNKI